MTPVSAASRSWSRRRWWGVVALVFLVQLALIFWLGETSPIRPHQAAPGFTLRLAGGAAAELLALRDPTLFVLPQPQAVAAPAWLTAPHHAAHAFTWPEPASPPAPVVGQLGAAFNWLAETNHFAPLFALARPEPRSVLPEPAPQPLGTGQSAVQLQGALAHRRLLAPLDLRSWTNYDILTNSVVQLLVDAEGMPRSVTLLAGSGSHEADQHALNQARTARFEPLGLPPADLAPAPTANLSWGRMVFLWHTLPLPPTNTPAASPQP